MIINLVVYISVPKGEALLLYVSAALPVLCALIAIICVLLAVRSFKTFDFTKIAWLLLLVGLILYCIAESIYGIVEIKFPEISNDFPGIADYFWYIGYIPVIFGLAMMLAGYKKSGLPMGKPSLYIGLSTLIFIIALLIFYFLLMPIIKDNETTGLAKAFYIFYPVADLFVVIPAAILIYITSLFGSAVITVPWKFLTLGFVLFTISDLLYAYLDWEGLYGNGNLIDLGWNFGYLLIAMSGLRQYLLVKSLK
jgi:hypothetical protein